MMVILSKKEYDDLIKKATAVDLIVEERVQAEKDRIWAALRAGLKSGRYSSETFHKHPAECIRELLDKVIG